ncbi:hypothetical protein GCM10008983_12430 [Lentibacillus halophilus]|uniref:Regulatory protein YycH domain-containing protein n=1 Tax=Lentibacillus halophilus TaxID=295065 RepID=A0ABN0Z889_9BACI
MRFETVKSVILWALVVGSLLLSFALWNYKPEVEDLPPEQFQDRVDLGGDEETKKNIIKPKSIIFRNEQHYYGFTDPNDSETLYQDMHSWMLYDFRTEESRGRPTESNQLEVVFPTAIPMSMLDSLFTFNGDPLFPDWDFERFFITFDEDDSSLQITFLDRKGDQQATAAVNNSETFSRLWQLLTTFEGLREYAQFDKAEQPIYIPKHAVEMANKSVAVREIGSHSMVDVLFRNPDAVIRNQINDNEVYFTDNARGIMRVYQDRRTMEFQNPLQSPFEQMEPAALLERSKNNINEYKGWTDDYHLMDIETSINTIRYQMFYDGYPVYGNNHASMIEQQYRIKDLNQPNRYHRPLFSLANLLSSKTEELPSGANVIDYLNNNKTYKPEQVDDIRIGYDLTYQGESDALTLEAAWFINYKGCWQKMSSDDITLQKGGS